MLYIFQSTQKSGLKKHAMISKFLPERCLYFLFKYYSFTVLLFNYFKTVLPTLKS